MTEDNSLVIDNTADPQGLSYTPDAKPEVKEAPKPLSAREALEKAASEIEEKGVKIGNDEKKPEPPKEGEEPAPAEKKTARAEDGKFAKTTQEPSDSTSEAKGTEQDGEAKSSPSEGREDDKPPARFLPRAKEKWATVDPDVRGEVLRMQAELEKGLTEHKESHEFRKSLREFEEMAKQAGTTVPDAIRNYTNIDNLLRSNPAAGIERILQSVGITPQQYAQHVMGQAQQQAANPQQAQVSAETQRLQSQIQQLTQTVQQLTQGTQQDREAARLSDLERTIINPFRAEHPRYDELQEDIVFFLNSDKIPSTLNERQRLETAYDMAERINPAPLSQAPQQTRPLNPAGAKSIKGSPSPGTTSRKMENLGSREAIEAAMQQIGL